MKLSMWMIANRLNALEPELHIRDDAPITLKSARRVYATNCVHVYQQGSDTICSGEGDYIKLKDMEVNQAFEIIQYIFDFYEDWNASLLDALKVRDYQKIIDNCWYIFHNPIVLMDANCKALALSSQYSEDDLDDEWKHLCEYGYSSVLGISFLRQDCTEYDFFHSNKIQLCRFPKGALKLDCLTAPVSYNDNLCGRINILEKERELNSGDVQLLTYLVSYLAPSLGQLDLASDQDSYYSVFLELLKNKGVNHVVLAKQLEYFSWTLADTYQLFVLRPEEKYSGPDYLPMISHMMNNYLKNCSIFIHQNYIIVLSNCRIHEKESLAEALLPLAEKNHLYLSESLPIRNIYNLYYFFMQTVYALEAARLKDIRKPVSFYQYAIDYIIESSSLQDACFACHPDISVLQERDQAEGSAYVETLHCYLKNERSPVATAKELFVHKNTLVYRIKKIEQLLTSDISDNYTRDYMKLSMRVLALYQQKYN